MIKKKDGYVLVYVVFVIIFLCIVAVGTCTVALSNLKTQTAYIEQMQDIYEAESAIEQFMAEVCSSAKGLYGSSQDAVGSAKTAFEDVIDEHQNDIILSNAEWKYYDNCYQFIITAKSTAVSNTAIATIDFSVYITTFENVGTGEDKNGDGVEDTVDKFNIDNATSKYLSYNLESTGGEAE